MSQQQLENVGGSRGSRQDVAKSSRRQGRRKRVTAYALLAPALLLSVVFFVVPVVLLVVMSFYNWPLLGEPAPVGLENFQSAFRDGNFWRAALFSLAFTVVLVPISMSISYFAAVMVRGTGKFVSFVRTAFFLPVVIGFTAAAYMTSVLFMQGTGVVNVLLRLVGLNDGQTAFFTDPTKSFWVVVGLTVWKSMGTAMLLLMAGMQGIPEEVIEAAKIDGAGWWRRELSIVFPLVRRQFALTMLLAVSGTLLVFDQFFVLTKGGPSGATTTAVMYVYQQSFIRYNLGYGSAISLIITVIILGIAIFQVSSLRDKTGGLRP